MMAIAAIGIVVLLIVIYLISTYNGFVRLRNKCEEAFSAMDVSLKKRYDLIPNLVETVKGYAKHESETLQAVIAARNKAAGASTAEARIEGDAALTGTLRHLFAVAESYPELKANENFTRLQDQLSRIEEELAAGTISLAPRRYYNGVVNKYNTKTEMFPSSLIAGMFGFARKPLYEVNSDAERENVTVSF